jgi:hypothetical protein
MLSAGVPILASIRATGLAMGVNLILMAVLLPNIKWKGRAALFAPMLAIMLGISTYNYFRLGVFVTSTRSGSTLLSNVAHMIDPDISSEHSVIANAMAERTAEFKRELADAKDFATLEKIKKRHHAAMSYARDELKGQNKEIKRYVKTNYSTVCIPGTEKHPTVRKVCVDNVMKDIAIDAIVNSPLIFLKRVFTNWLGYWRITHDIMELDPNEILTRAQSQGQPYLPAFGYEIESLERDYPKLLDKPNPYLNSYRNFIRLYLKETSLLKKTNILPKWRVGYLLSAVEALTSAIVIILLVYVATLQIRKKLSIAPKLFALGAMALSLTATHVMASMAHHALKRYATNLEFLPLLLLLLSVATLTNYLFTKVTKPNSKNAEALNFDDERKLVVQG